MLKLHYDSFMVCLNRCNRIPNSFDDKTKRKCFLNKTHTKLIVFNMIARKKQLKTLKKTYFVRL